MKKSRGVYRLPTFDEVDNEVELSERDMTRLDETLNVEDTLSFMKRFVNEMEELKAENESLRSEVEKHKQLRSSTTFPARGLGEKSFAIVADRKVAKCNRHTTPSDQTAWVDGNWMKIKGSGLNTILTIDKNGKPHALIESGITIHCINTKLHPSCDLEKDKKVEQVIKSYVENHDLH